ncbi:MAG: ABC transporter permease [Bacteroidota bacterium]
MLLNYIRIAGRNMRHHLVTSSINVLGLALGLAVSGMLLLYVDGEFQYDGFHHKNGHLYQIWTNLTAEEGQIHSGDRVPSPLAARLVQSIPEIKQVARTFPQTNRLTLGKKSLIQEGLYADPAFLEMFSFSLLQGNPKTALRATNSLVITQSVALALFGSQDPMGKIVTFANQEPLIVSGILKDLPHTSTLQFGFLVPWSFWEKRVNWKSDQEWGYYSFPTYVELDSHASPQRVDAKIRDVLAQAGPEGSEQTLFLHPMSQWHLYTEFKNGQNVGGRITYIRLFLGLALGILLIACINYMNLSTARSQKRAREVGVRKVVGATRRSLTGQFLTESMVISFLALTLAWLLVSLALPHFNQLAEAHLSLDYHQPRHWMGAVGITLLTGLIAGSYPAFYLASFQPIRVLKRTLQVGKAALRPRQVLVVVQFSFAIALVIVTSLIYQQLRYIQNRPIGYQKTGLVQVSMEGKLHQEFERFRRVLIESGAVIEACATSSRITDANSSTSLEWPGQKPNEKQLIFDQIRSTYPFAATFGIHIKQGRAFSEAFATDSSAVLLNETAVRLMHLKEPIGQVISWQGEARRVVGVFEDFVWDSPFEPARPMVVAAIQEGAGTFALRLNPARSINASLIQIEQVYKQFNSSLPFEYQFVDEAFDQKLRFEKKLGLLANGFAGLAVFISCLGLFGLSAFSVEQRRKEVGIRKVLGASLSQLWFTLSKDILGLIVLSFFLAAPSTYWLMHHWLQKYPYHTPISGWLIVLAGVGALSIVLLTISFQTFKAANANPVNSLRSE